MIQREHPQAKPFPWREASEIVGKLQGFRQDVSHSHDEGTVRLDTDKPIGLLCLADTHVGSWGTDHDMLVRITDEILETPQLYVCILGDFLQMAINMRSVSEVSDNVLPPSMQLEFMEAWLNDVAHRVLFMTWDNHAVEREERQAGRSAYAAIAGKQVLYHSGIGHPNVVVGGQEYRLAVSHRFRGRNQDNPCAGTMRYLRREGFDREIGLAGDSHEFGIFHFTHGPMEKLAVNSGSLQTNSRYAKRYFSLYTHTLFPVVELHPDRHQFTGFRCVGDWLKSTGRA